jgi:ribosome-binding factor A
MKKSSSKTAGPSQRQLRASEVVRHALVEVMREHEIPDPLLNGVSITVTQVRLSPDFRHATVFVEPLGAGLGGPEARGHIAEVIDALNNNAKFLRGRLGRHIDMKFTPDLRFRHDDSFEAAKHMDTLFNSPSVRRDLGAPEGGDDGQET